jgi:hypothetical protein
MTHYPSAYTKEEQMKMIARCRAFFTPSELQEMLGMSRATWYRRLAELKTRMAPKPTTEEHRQKVARVIAELEAAAIAANKAK